MPYEPFPTTFPTLSDPDLLLRELGVPDLPAWFARMSDVESGRLSGDPVATSPEDARAALEFHLQAFRETTGIRWAIVTSQTRASIGTVGLSRLNPVSRTAELGAVLGRAFWGQRFGSHAARLVLDYGFNVLGLQEVHAVSLPENSRSIAALATLGFRPAGCPGELAVSGRPDSVLYTLQRGSAA